MRVSLSKSGRSFSAPPDRSILEAALDAGVNLPHGCRGGNCGACRARLVSGEVTYPNGRPLGLSNADIGDGYVLLCQARALGDLRIETLEPTTPDAVVVRRLPGRIERIQGLSHDVMGVYLRLPAAEPFPFRAGQYLDILLSGGRRRSFSIASPPHDSPLVELHVRRVVGGEFTESLFAGGAAGALLSIEGPLGEFAYREGAVPLLLVGGGTGLAPLKSILRHVIETRFNRDVTLYWGVRSQRDLYADDELRALQRRTAAFRYLPVLSEPDGDWRGISGLVHEAVMRNERSLHDLDIYAAGPPAMIDALRREFPGAGADPSRILADSFDYAPDAVERHRRSAASRS